MTKTNKSIGSFDVCKDAADQFFAVANKCFGKDPMEYLANGFYPYAVNIAFACELYVKAIMIFRSQNDEFFRGHDLKDLFSYLDTSDFNNIEKQFESQLSKKSFSSFLVENGKTFVDWRYALEAQVSIDLSGFNVLANILKDYVNTLNESRGE